MKKHTFATLVLLLAVLFYWEPPPTEAQTLPSAGTAGRLGRLSGGGAAGAIVVDDGTEWHCLEAKATGVLNIACPPYNAVGDGATNNATAIQTAINDAIADGGTVYIPKGTFRYNTTLLIDGDLVQGGKGFTIQGASRTQSVLQFGGTGWALHLQGKDIGSLGWVRYVTVENLRIQTLTNGNDGIFLSGVVFYSTFRNLEILGSTASGLGTAILLDGGCICYNRFENINISGYQRGMWWARNANVNTVQNTSVGGVGFAYLWDVAAANQECHASGNPFTCCTGDGTGTGLDECESNPATNPRPGYGNTIISADATGSTTLNGFTLRDGTHDNVFIGLTCDCGSIDNCLSVNDNPLDPGFGSNLFVGANYCGAVDIGGTLGTSTVFIGGSLSTTGDGEGNSISIGTIPPIVNGELMSLDGGANAGDLKLDGATGGCFMMRDRDDAGWTEITFLNGAMSATTDTDGICDGS